jgi:hypothetical protein
MNSAKPTDKLNEAELIAAELKLYEAALELTCPHTLGDCLDEMTRPRLARDDDQGDWTPLVRRRRRTSG